MIEDACTIPPLFTNFSFPRKINLFQGLYRFRRGRCSFRSYPKEVALNFKIKFKR